MSTLKVTTVTSPDPNTDLILASGNSQSGQILISANGAGVTLKSNSTVNAITINTTSWTFSNNPVFSTNTFTVGTGTYFVASGRVGIGNSSPSEKLVVDGSIVIANGFNFSWGGSYGANVATIYAISGNDAYIAINPAGNVLAPELNLYANSNGYASFRNAVTYGFNSPLRWPIGYHSIQMGSSYRTSFMGSSNDGHMITNAWYDGTNWRYDPVAGAGNVGASDYYQGGGVHGWRYATAGTANSVITWNSGMVLDSSGNLNINSDTAYAKFTIKHTVGSNYISLIPTTQSSNQATSTIFLGGDGVSSITSRGCKISNFNGSGSDVNQLTFSTGYVGNITEKMRINHYGDVGIGSNNPVGTIDLGGATNGKSIVWGGAYGDAHYSSIWTAYSYGHLILATGYKSNTAADTYLSSFNSPYLYRNAIKLDAYDSNGIRFYTDTPASAAVGTSLTPTERMRIDTYGRVTKPYQPIFSATNPSNSGASNDYVKYNSVTVNVGSHYNVTTGLFTAPVAGNYFFTAAVFGDTSTSSSSYFYIRFYKNGAGYGGSAHSQYNDTRSYEMLDLNWATYLAAGDTVGVYFIGSTSTIYGGSYGNFSGHLVG